MNFNKYIYLPIFPLIAVLLTHTNGAAIDVQNNCNYTIWPAAVPGGGQRLDPGQMWAFNASSKQFRVWARTMCNFDQAGRKGCQTGDCNGLLQCQTYGLPPVTLVEFALSQFNNMDLFDISLVDGFNVPVELSPTSGGCTRVTRCTADINGQCPNELRAPGGCNNPCTVFKSNEYCCYSGNCVPTHYSQFFKNSCPDAYYPSDQASSTSTLTCPAGTDYKVVFCPK